MTLFNQNPVDLEAYNGGITDWQHYEQTGEKLTNPYQFGTDKWFSWNKGWNSVDPESKKNLLQYASEYVQGNDEVKPSVKAITDFQVTEVSLMPDGTYQPAFSFSAKDLNVSQSTLDQLRSQVRKLPDAQMWMIDNHDVVAGPFSIPGEQYEQLKRLADSQEDGEIAPIDNDL